MVSGTRYTDGHQQHPQMLNAQTKLNSHTPSLPSLNPDQTNLPLSSSLIAPICAIADAGANAGCRPAIATRTAWSTSFTDTAAPSFDSVTILMSPVWPERRMTKMNTGILNCSMVIGTLFCWDSVAAKRRYSTSPASTRFKAGRRWSGGRLLGARP
ncbi:hypothetical protein BDQ12DRAFT_72678 [Crucibulum laeve]|uniref:Uncharacterized protein n=1 Tax=Crucibulum laeve TaxID=68775 RepID=A0A5C3M219_9AGAR|nr:hypothetical protein BDQ12DRAFT_72678 [Crucibulum laeve]